MLTAEKLREFSGFQQSARVLRWLQENNIPYILDRNNDPITTETCITDAIKEGRGGEVGF